jgi:hypothetical protein
MKKRYSGLIVCVLACYTCVGSCTGPWRPPPHIAAPQMHSGPVELASFLRPSPVGRWLYERRELTFGSTRTTDSYVRRITGDRMAEGVLEPLPFPPVSYYLPAAEPESETTSPATQPAARSRPAAPLKGGLGLLFELDEPLPPIPPELSADAPHTASTTIRYYDRHGKLDAEGTLSRVAEIEGIEDVECPAGLYEDCLRVRVDLTFRFGWGHVVEWTSYMWLSPQVGEVRRIQRMWGRVWVLWFSSAHEYRLVSFEPEQMTPVSMGPTAAWSRGAILLDQGFPHPRIGGMVVDYAPPTVSE